MELKKILAVGAAVAISLGARAGTSEEVSSSNEFGLLKIVSSSSRIILGVPWCACSGEDSDRDIMVKDLVSTRGLDVGSTLNAYDADGRSYHSWRVNAEHEWEGVTEVCLENGIQSFGTTYETDTLKRGVGLVLLRYNNSGSNPIYLHGQLAKVSGGAQGGTIVGGTEDAPAYTLVACPNDAAWKPNLNLVFTGDSDLSDYDGDELIGLMDNGTQYRLFWVANQDSIKKLKKNGTFTNPGWYSIYSKTTTKTGPGGRIITTTTQTLQLDDKKVDAGIGFWYVSKSGNDRTFSWSWTAE